jgi:hypothetical protein
MDPTTDGLGAGGWGFPDARPGVATFTDLMTASMAIIMTLQFQRRFQTHYQTTIKRAWEGNHARR